MRPTTFLKTLLKAKSYCTSKNTCVFHGFFFSVFTHFSQAPKIFKIGIVYYASILKKAYREYFMQSQLTKVKVKVTV